MSSRFVLAHRGWAWLAAVPWIGLAGCSCPTAYREMKLTPAGLEEVRAVPDGAALTPALCESLCEGRARAEGQPHVPISWSCELERRDEGSVVLCNGQVACVGGRRPDGAELSGATDEARYFGASATTEAASVVAFLELAEALFAHGAPHVLVRRALDAAREEVGHARAMAAIALARGEALAPLVIERSDVPTLEALARSNAVEGCASELFAARVASHQAAHARRALAPTFRAIAREEAAHAALSLDIHAWASGGLSRGARRRVAEAQGRKRRSLARTAERASSPRHVRDAGWPSAERAVEIALSLPSFA